jgi:hypothetical protein
MLEASQVEEEDENSEEWLNLFSQEDDKTATMKLTVKEEVDNIDFSYLCEYIEFLERREEVQSMHIQ